MLSSVAIKNGVCPHSCCCSALTRVAQHETGRVRLSTLLPRAVNPREARANRRRDGVQTRVSKEIFVKFLWPMYPLINRNIVFFFQNFGGFFDVLAFFFEILMVFLSKIKRDTRLQPGETRDPLTRAPRTAKKARP